LPTAGARRLWLVGRDLEADDALGFQIYCGGELLLNVEIAELAGASKLTPGVPSSA
jgi:hypothetical protein